MGADTFADYLGFRVEKPSGNVQQFISEHLVLFEIADTDWDLLDEARLQAALDADDGFSVLKRDDFIVGLAFAQLLIDGAVDAEIKQRALLALRRQSARRCPFISRRGSADARKNQLMDFQRVLQAA